MFHYAISRKKTQGALFTKVLGFSAAFFFGHVSLLAGSYTVPLNLTEHTSKQGDYLAADYDFEMTFSNIEEISVEFMMPNGYEGGSSTTGNSSQTRSVLVSVHGSVKETLDLTSVSYSRQSSVGEYVFNVEQNYLATAYFTPLSAVKDPIDPNVVFLIHKYPEFLLAGDGSVSFTEELLSFTPLLPSGQLIHVDSTYSLPGEISLASLTIVGTPVPEPGSFVLIVLAISGAGLFGWHKKQVRV